MVLILTDNIPDAVQYTNHTQLGSEQHCTQSARTIHVSDNKFKYIFNVMFHLANIMLMMNQH